MKNEYTPTSLKLNHWLVVWSSCIYHHSHSKVSETTGTVQRSGRTSSAVAGRREGLCSHDHFINDVAITIATGLSSLSSFLIPPAPSPSPSHMQWRFVV